MILTALCLGISLMAAGVAIYIWRRRSALTNAPVVLAAQIPSVPNASVVTLCGHAFGTEVDSHWSQRAGIYFRAYEHYEQISHDSHGRRRRNRKRRLIGAVGRIEYISDDSGRAPVDASNLRLDGFQESIVTPDVHMGVGLGRAHLSVGAGARHHIAETIIEQGQRVWVTGSVVGGVMGGDVAVSTRDIATQAHALGVKALMAIIVAALSAFTAVITVFLV